MPKVRVIRTIPGRHEIGEVVEMNAGEATAYIQSGKVVPHGGDAEISPSNKMISDSEVQKRAPSGNRK